MSKYKGCSIDAKLRQMVSWTCVSGRCYRRMMGSSTESKWPLCSFCRELYREGFRSLHHALLGAQRDWEMRGLYNTKLVRQTNNRGEITNGK